MSKLTTEQLETIRTTMSEMVAHLPFEAVFMIATPHDVIISTPTTIADNKNKARDTYVNATTTLAKNLIDNNRQTNYDEKIREYRKDEDTDDDKPIWMK